MSKAQAGISGGPGAWHGVIRVGGRAVWTCGHAHANRDQSTMTSGRSARDCACFVLMAAERPEYLPSLRQWYANPTVSMRPWEFKSGLAQMKYAENVVETVRAAIAAAPEPKPRRPRPVQHPTEHDCPIPY